MQVISCYFSWSDFSRNISFLLSHVFPNNSVTRVQLTLLSASDIFLIRCCRGHDFSKSFGPRTVIICDQVLILCIIALPKFNKSFNFSGTVFTY